MLRTKSLKFNFAQVKPKEKHVTIVLSSDKVETSELSHSYKGDFCDEILTHKVVRPKKKRLPKVTDYKNSLSPDDRRFARIVESHMKFVEKVNQSHSMYPPIRESRSIKRLRYDNS